jgi:hypothetical protein
VSEQATGRESLLECGGAEDEGGWNEVVDKDGNTVPEEVEGWSIVNTTKYRSQVDDGAGSRGSRATTERA